MAIPKPDKSTPIVDTDQRSVLQSWFDFFGYLESQAKSFAASIVSLAASIAGYEAAWTVYNPAVTASSGTFTSVSATGSFLTIGKLVHYTCTITITTVGTAAGSIVLPLPAGTAVRNAVGMGMASNLGKSVGYRILATGSSGDMTFYDNSSAIAAGNVIIVTGIYERA